MKFLHALSGAILGCFVFLALAQPAKADPHAVFYTTIGQQQLFYNVLAALDQADYVEPAQNTIGTPPGQSRKELEDKRSGTEFGAPAADPRLVATTTNLASVLTRNITLEGHDLWTAYQIYNRANNFQIRIALAELNRLYCQNALGVDDCDFSDAKKVKHDTSFITDYVIEAAKQVAQGALAVFLSGTQVSQSHKQKIVQDYQEGKIPAQPYEYDPAVAEAWDNVTPSTAKQKLWEGTLGAAISGQLPPVVDSKIYDDIAYNNQEFQPTFQLEGTSSTPGTSLSGTDYTNRYVTTLYRLLRNSAAVASSGEAGASRVALEQRADQEGFRAEKVLDAKSEDSSSGYTQLETNVIVPSKSRVGDTLAAKNAGVIGDSSTSSAPADGLNLPGQETITNTQRQGGSVSGATTTTSSELLAQATAQQDSPGEVAGILDTIGQYLADLFGFYDQERPAVGINENISPAHDEEGLASTLTAFDREFNNSRTGYSQGLLDSIIDWIIDLF